MITAVAYAMEPKEGDTPIQWANERKPPGEPTISGVRVESSGSSIFVHEGKGKECKSLYASMFEFNIDRGSRHCDLSWEHSITYYNDAPGADAVIYAWVKLFEKAPRENVPLEDIPLTVVAEDFVNSDDQGNIIENCKGRVEGGGGNLLVLSLDVAYNGFATTGVLTRTLGNCFDADGDGAAEHHPVKLEDGHFYRLFANSSLKDPDDEVDDRPDITWSRVNARFPMHRSDYREYVQDPNDPNREFDPSAAWFNGSNSVGGEFGSFQIE